MVFFCFLYLCPESLKSGITQSTVVRVAMANISTTTITQVYKIRGLFIQVIKTMLMKGCNTHVHVIFSYIVLFVQLENSINLPCPLAMLTCNRQIALIATPLLVIRKSYALTVFELAFRKWYLHTLSFNRQPESQTDYFY